MKSTNCERKLPQQSRSVACTDEVTRVSSVVAGRAPGGGIVQCGDVVGAVCGGVSVVYLCCAVR